MRALRKCGAATSETRRRGATRGDKERYKERGDRAPGNKRKKRVEQRDSVSVAP